MADIFGLDLLANPKAVSDTGDVGGSGGGGMISSDLPAAVDVPPAMEMAIPELDTIDLGAAPSFMPKAEDIGEKTTADGFVNKNAEPWAEPPKPKGQPRSLHEILARKRQLLRKFERMGRRGRGPSRTFTMDDSLEEMEEEDRANKADNDMEFAMDLMAKATIGFANIAERAATAMPKLGLRLQNYGRNTDDAMTDFYPIFEELYEKYSGIFSLGPEMKYVYMLAMGAYMTHTINQMTTEYGPTAGDVLRKNPDLAKQFAERYMEETVSKTAAGGAGAGAGARVEPAPKMTAAAGAGLGSRPMAPPPPPHRDVLADIASFGGIGLGGPPAPVKPQARPELKGPSGDLDGLLNSIPMRTPSGPGSVTSTATGTKEKKRATIKL